MANGQVRDMRNLRKKIFDLCNSIFKDEYADKGVLAEAIISTVSVDENGNQLCLNCNNTPPMVKNPFHVLQCPTCGATLSR